MRPVTVEKHVVERDPFTQQRYPDTPPSSSTLSSIDIDEAGPAGRLSKIKRINVVCQFSQLFLLLFVVSKTSDSDNSIHSSKFFYFGQSATGLNLRCLFHMLGIKPTKYSVLDFFACIASKQKPVANEEQYIYRYWSMEELVGQLNGYLAIVESSNFKTKVVDWLAKDDHFGRSKMCRVGATTVWMRSLWVLKEEHRRK